MSLATRETEELEEGLDVLAEGPTNPRARTPASRGAAGVHRVNVNFPESIYKVLEELAQRRGKTMAEVLRDAIVLEKWIDDARAQGARLLLKEGDEMRELVLR